MARIDPLRRMRLRLDGVLKLLRGARKELEDASPDLETQRKVDEVRARIRAETSQPKKNRFWDRRRKR